MKEKKEIMNREDENCDEMEWWDEKCNIKEENVIIIPEKKLKL